MSNTIIFEISLSKIQSAFKQMAGEANWDTKEKMIWGYYFLDHNLQKLEEFSFTLKDAGFNIVEMKMAGDEDYYLLHVEEHMIHSAKSLYHQCQNLAHFARKNEIEFFDGWDVEKEKMNKGLVE